MNKRHKNKWVAESVDSVVLHRLEESKLKTLVAQFCTSDRMGRFPCRSDQRATSTDDRERKCTANGLRSIRVPGAKGSNVNSDVALQLRTQGTPRRRIAGASLLGKARVAKDAKAHARQAAGSEGTRKGEI